MKVKVGNKWYDGEDIPIAIEFTPADKINIANMAPGMTRYAICNEKKYSTQDMRDWLSDLKEL